jgi:hypothetical protein
MTEQAFDNKIDIPPLGLVYCLCGCGELMFITDEWGRERGYIRGHNPTSTRFKRGHIPWNKKKK